MYDTGGYIAEQWGKNTLLNNESVRYIHGAINEIWTLPQTTFALLLSGL